MPLATTPAAACRTAAFAATLALLVAGPSLRADPPKSPGYSWARPHARVLETGDLDWQPEPYEFQAGESVRYIDYDGGSDANDGRTPAAAWRHHPWDANARGRAADAEVDTYVFKQGVIYRGALSVDAAVGEPGRPIRLTVDPDWGEGEAAIYGSVAVRDGWRRGAEHDDIPEPEHVWWVDLDFLPRNVWMVDDAGEVTRLPLARTPNWQWGDVDDVKAHWWQWNNENAHQFNNRVEAPGGRELYLGIDTENLTREADYYQGATVWTEYGWVASTPYPARVHVVDTERRGLGFGGQFGGINQYVIVRGARYYLEDKPHYLDDPNGEFWVDRDAGGGGGRLYLRLPDGVDPRDVTIEAARHRQLVDARQLRHVHISGLTFRFTNVSWALNEVAFRTGERNFVRREGPLSATIRLMGPGRDVRISHCRFEHVNRAVYMTAGEAGEDLDAIAVTDNDIRFADIGAIHLTEGALWGHMSPRGMLRDVRVMRNRLHTIGQRPTRYGGGVAIDVTNPRTAEIAGNMHERLWGQGVNVRGGKRGQAAWDVPLSRILIHHNRVIDPMLNNNDFGGIETWQSGSFYVYNNIVGNPGGYQHWRTVMGTSGPKRFGFAYYLDGAFKNYLFNNIAWGRSSDREAPEGNRAAIQEIHSFQNSFFNNTFYNFVKGSRRQAPQGGRNRYLANVWDTIGDWVFRHADPARTQAAGNEADAGPPARHFALETNAYARNVFHDVARFGVFRPSGQWHEPFDEARDVLREAGMIEHEMGVVAEASPLRDAANHDFRPVPGGAAIGRGARVFVPWALYRTVGEWGFHHPAQDPTRIIDDHWYMRPYYIDRRRYEAHPRFPLTAVNVTRDDYVDSPLENWTRAALRFNGQDQYAYLANDELNGPLEYTVNGQWQRASERETRVAEGASFTSPQVHASNFLVELYVRIDPGQGEAVLVRKMDDAAGYAIALDDAGRVSFEIRAGGQQSRVTGDERVDTGGWHHLIAEADRDERTLTLYIDGEARATAAGVGPGASLANDADLYVAGTPDGEHLAGTFAFLRISLGTLADALTDIDELHAWQFAGPHLRDFRGRDVAGARDAGAIQGER
ncbi:MAG: LamG domain-containing protein [Phycisphaeraceae bacterium]